MIKSILFLLSLLFVFPFAKDKKKPKATIVIKNAIVHTMDSKNTIAECIALRGEEIIYVGKQDKIDGYINRKTKVIDAHNQVVLPGFIDAHTHPISLASFDLEVKGYKMEKLLKELKIYIDTHPNNKTIIGVGGFAYNDPNFDISKLDEIAPNTPIVLVETDGHGGWINSKGIALLDDLETTEFSENSYFEKNVDGKYSGVIVEAKAYYYAIGKVLKIKENLPEFDDRFKALSKEYNSLGYTTVFDATAGNNDVSDVLFGRLAKISNGITMRVEASYLTSDLEELKTAKVNTSNLKKHNTELFNINTIKVFMDGTMEGYNAALDQPYIGTNTNGNLFFSGNEFQNELVNLAQNNFDIHFHAIGPRAIHEAVIASQKIREQGADVKLTIAHAELIRDEDFQVILENDIIINTTPLWHSYDDFTFSALGQERFNKIWRYNPILEENGHVTFGTDHPSSYSLSPFEHIQTAITRQNKYSGDKKLADEKQKFSIQDAVKAFTTSAAYQLNLANDLGSIEVGKKADLILINQDIFSIDETKIKATKVTTTIFNGKVVYSE
ncbi:amidohydrolase [Flammeovirga pectinis]|uniref:Amidohydrolase n=1 Tax=Flammeovirga pectinis TaxID=2494373 RepID=A0A3S9P6E4_9BACT|nr:amidohydrolase [Flammeovirga pectinis]AZQ63789.1 amidohydrolase [Flammeovirga pectinis]